MLFTSDNWAGAHRTISKRLGEAAEGFAPAYGTSDLDEMVTKKFSELFERDVSVFFVSTGTAANSLALASVQRPGGAVFCHTEAHVVQDECGAPDFFSGMRMVPINGLDGRIDPGALEQALSAFPQDAVHHGRAAAITVIQGTELGTVYELDDIDRIAAIGRHHGIPLHMDGARFANALVALDTTPAEMTWRRGVDILSFGATKNGCWCAEAIVFFDTAKAKDMHFIRKRAAQLFSKSRFIAAQFDAYLADDLWLDIARHANFMADQLRGNLDSVGARPAWQTATNEVFAIVSKTKAAAAIDAGARFYEWPVPAAIKEKISLDETLVRLVTSFATSERDIQGLLSALS
jgi:threonine aldolase